MPIRRIALCVLMVAAVVQLAEAGSAGHDEAVEYFIEIPLVGTFDSPSATESRIVPGTVRRVLEYASENDVRHIVLTVDSPGGRVSAVEEIVAAMQDFGDDLTYYAIVKRGISASIWPIFASDHVFLVEGATIGGAVPYTRGDGGDTQVDDKMSSILAAELGAIAEEKGHHPVLVRGMIVPKTRVYSWVDAHGSARVGSAVPDSGVTDVQEMSVEGSVLTLTAGEAVQIGWARVAPENVDQLGEVLGHGQWRRANRIGHVAIEFDRVFRNIGFIEDEFAEQVASWRKRYEDYRRMHEELTESDRRYGHPPRPFSPPPTSCRHIAS